MNVDFNSFVSVIRDNLPTPQIRACKNENHEGQRSVGDAGIGSTEKSGKSEGQQKSLVSVSKV